MAKIPKLFLITNEIFVDICLRATNSYEVFFGKPKKKLWIVIDRFFMILTPYLLVTSAYKCFWFRTVHHMSELADKSSQNDGKAFVLTDASTADVVYNFIVFRLYNIGTLVQWLIGNYLSFDSTYAFHYYRLMLLFTSPVFIWPIFLARSWKLNLNRAYKTKQIQINTCKSLFKAFVKVPRVSNCNLIETVSIDGQLKQKEYNLFKIHRCDCSEKDLDEFVPADYSKILEDDKLKFKTNNLLDMTDSKKKYAVHLSKSRVESVFNSKFNNSVRSYDFLKNNCNHRWLYIYFNAWFRLIVLGMMYCVIIFLFCGAALEEFFEKKLQVTKFVTSSNTKLITRIYVEAFMFAELIYVSLIPLFYFVITMTFFSVCHLDLCYRIYFIQGKLHKLRDFYKFKKNYNSVDNDYDDRELHLLQAKKQQARLWWYFDYIGQLDSFVGNYSALSSIFVVYLVFTSILYHKVEYASIKYSTSVALFWYLVSYTYLFFCSWDIERKVSECKSII